MTRDRQHPDGPEDVPAWRVERVAGGSPVGWDRHAPVTLVRSEDGGPARLATAVRLAHDGRRLLARFDCEDPDPWSTFARRDDPLWEQEAVEVFLGAGPDAPGRYVEVEVSPAGVVFDAVVDNPDGSRATMRVDPGWDAHGLEAVAVAIPGGWRAEIAVPLGEVAAVLGLAAIPRVWRANLYRIDRPRDGSPEDFTAWVPTGRTPPDFHVPSRFGVVRLDA